MTDDTDKLEERIEKMCNMKHKFIKEEMDSMKAWISKVDNRTWIILVAILINIGVQIALKM